MQDKYQFCSHTSFESSIAWVQVDLGSTHSLKNVHIYYRSVAGWPPYRFRQSYLDVSNKSANSSTTLTPQRVRCYTDNTTAPDTPSDIIDINCHQTARYVIVETTYDAPEDTESGPVLEICEIEVFGCSIGSYGESCSACPGCFTCNIINGSCPCSGNCLNSVCNPSGEYCTEGCKKGFWGYKCMSVCNEHCSRNICFQENGTCTNSCTDFYYGYQCDYQCASNCNPKSCDRLPGTCSGCRNGYYGVFCDKTCSPFCRRGICSLENGVCSRGCKSHRTGPFCDKCVPTYYGSNCNKLCSRNCLLLACSTHNGTCFGGCRGDFVDERCTIPAPNSTEIEHDPKCTQWFGIGVGATVVSLFLLSGIVLLVMLIRLRRKKICRCSQKFSYRKHYEDKDVVLNTENNQDITVTDTGGSKGATSLSEKDECIYQNEIMNTSEAGDNIEASRNSYDPRRANIYLTIAETDEDNSKYDQLYFEK